MKVHPVEFRGTHPYSFRRDQWAAVIGVAMVEPDGLPPRPCFVVRFADGVTDYTPMHDSGAYELRAAQPTESVEATPQSETPPGKGGASVNVI